MSTTLVKPAEVERKWYLLDAAGKSLGHVAAEAAVLLRGKQKVDYTPNVDCGDFVVVINCDQAVLTGKKAEHPRPDMGPRHPEPQPRQGYMVFCRRVPFALERRTDRCLFRRNLETLPQMGDRKSVV